MLVVFKTLETNQRFNYIQSLNFYKNSLLNHRCVYFLLNRDIIYAMRKIINVRISIKFKII